MLKNVLTKSIYERRMSTLFWALAITGFSVMILSLFPTFRDTFGEALQNVPDGLRNLLGEASSYQTISGYMDTILFSRIVFLTLIMGIVMATSLMSGEENDGRLQTLLAQPVSRTKVYWHKFLAMGVVIMLALVGMLSGAALGTLFVGEFGNLDWARMLQAVLMVWLVTMTFATLAFAIGAAFGRKGLAGIATGFLAFALFLIDSLADTATVLKGINNFSPFKYYNDPGILEHGVSTQNIVILGAAILVLSTAGWLIFRKRDVYQR